LCVMRYTFHFFSRSRQMSNLLIHFPKSLIWFVFSFWT
jgi:hypothetical protein